MTMSEKLTRQVDFTVTGDDGDGLTLEGYGAVFNVPTRINSWEGEFDEVIAPGAFKRTIDRKGPKGIRLQFNHGQDQLFGGLPIGAIEELREDVNGLYVRARLHDNWHTKPIRDAIASGAIEGMSFRFIVHNEERDTSGDVERRLIREVELFEVGPVVWPAYPETTVGVRSGDANDPVKFLAALLRGNPDVRSRLADELDDRLGPTNTPDARQGVPVTVPATGEPSADAPVRDLPAEAKRAAAGIRQLISERKDAA
jgi:HK97 family phage prohead protease